MTLSFHIRHEVTPIRVKEVFDAICNKQNYEHVTQAHRQEARLRQLGLVADGYATETGLLVHNLCSRKANLWGDLVHYLHYTLWRLDGPTDNGFSWTYRQCTDHLWQKKQTDMDSFWEPAVSFLINEAESSVHFGGRIKEATRDGTVSLSKDSLVGAKHWLEALTPPVIEKDTFARRYFCPPELTLLATGWVAQTMESEIGIDFLLTPERREAICRLCLLEPSALDKALDWMLPLYPDVIQPGTSAGVYGRFLHFLKWPEIQDLLR